jgi:hypothetical protein
MAKNFLEVIEQQEMIHKLIDNGHGKFVDALLMHEGKCFTKRGRVNKSGICRVLGCKTKQLEDELQACREILEGNP